MYLANPLARIVFGFQGALYGDPPEASPVLARLHGRPARRRLAIVLLVSTMLLLRAWRLFFSMSGDFAEEL